MRSSAIITSALVAFTNALGCVSQSCTLNEIPANVTCGATGYISASDTPYVKKSQAEGNIENCLASCTGGCKAVSFDTQYKTCYIYIAPVSKMKLYQVSSPMTFHYFDRACTFEARDKQCGPTGFISTNTPYYKKSQTEGTIENCLAGCRGGCKAVSFDVQYKTCYYYTAPVANMKLYTVKSPMSFYYFDRACGFENTSKTVCGQTASTQSSGSAPYTTSSPIATKADCLAACRADSECKGASYTASSKACALYNVAVKDTGAVLGTTPAVNAFYDASCYECNEPAVY
ncbi:hypothetical protein F5X68DRAFT_191562 [Plectosphaerella plurivora]|uniref:Apple domain-containing protein n=1 Tax=Plectosphaerella plurivora TaxID=936078 RepID=A0A9P9ABL1_9PEZI|nr:hypothetical protein F5X68DRAFT_191562 [Plectosphaerella plurivora]